MLYILRALYYTILYTVNLRLRHILEKEVENTELNQLPEE